MVNLIDIFNTCADNPTTKILLKRMGKITCKIKVNTEYFPHDNTAFIKLRVEKYNLVGGVKLRKNMKVSKIAEYKPSSWQLYMSK